MLHANPASTITHLQHVVSGYFQNWVTIKIKMPHLTMTRAVFWFARSTTRHRTKDRTRGRRQ